MIGRSKFFGLVFGNVSVCCFFVELGFFGLVFCLVAFLLFFVFLGGCVLVGFVFGAFGGYCVRGYKWLL